MCKVTTENIHFYYGLRQQNEPCMMEGSGSVSVATRDSLAVKREREPVQKDTCSQVYSPDAPAAPLADAPGWGITAGEI